MKRDFSSIEVAALLGLGCVAFRLVSGLYPEVVPNVSPLLALSFVAGLYFPRRWGWAVGPAACLVTEVALIPTSLRATGMGVPWFGLMAVAFYLLASAVGRGLAGRKSLGKILAGSVVLSVLFYVGANTFAWGAGVVEHLTTSYAPTWAGWWQANTTGLPGYAPSWTFLRNGVLGDLAFLGVFLLVLDPGMLRGRTQFPNFPKLPNGEVGTELRN
jgi:hypothetical protein